MNNDTVTTSTNDTTPVQMTHYDAATLLLSNPKAKLTGSQRKDLKKARIVFAAEKTPGVEKIDRAVNRRLDRIAAKRRKLTTPTPTKDLSEKLLHHVAKKNVYQLRNAVVRGQRRALRFALAASAAAAPKIKAALQQTSVAFQNSAECAKAEHQKRISKAAK